eukprot:scaffold103998_cov69-Phaeocystis_antarctica.AAC.6
MSRSKWRARHRCGCRGQATWHAVAVGRVAQVVVVVVVVVVVASRAHVVVAHDLFAIAQHVEPLAEDADISHAPEGCGYVLDLARYAVDGQVVQRADPTQDRCRDRGEGHEALLVAVPPLVAEHIPVGYVPAPALEGECGLAIDHLSRVRSLCGVAIDLEALYGRPLVDPHPECLVPVPDVHPFEREDLVLTQERQRCIRSEDGIRWRCRRRCRGRWWRGRVWWAGRWWRIPTKTR